jgi:hypothetical protein
MKGKGFDQMNIVRGQAVDPEELLRFLPNGFGFIVYKNGEKWHLYDEPTKYTDDLQCLKAGANRLHGADNVCVYQK